MYPTSSGKTIGRETRVGAHKRVSWHVELSVLHETTSELFLFIVNTWFNECLQFVIQAFIRDSVVPLHLRTVCFTAQAVSRLSLRPEVFIPDHFVWDLWWIKCNWYKSASYSSFFHLPLTEHICSKWQHHSMRHFVLFYIVYIVHCDTTTAIKTN